MERSDIIKLFLAISTLYPRETAFAVKDDKRGNTMVDMWLSMLGDLTLEAAGTALKVHATKSQWAPSIAEIRKEAAAINSSEAIMIEDEAWGLVTNAIRKYGFYQPKKFRESLPIDIWQLVERIGFEELNLMTFDNVPVIRGQFCRMWRAKNERAKEQAALPKALKEQIATIGAKMELKMIGGK